MVFYDGLAMACGLRMFETRSGSIVTPCVVGWHYAQIAIRTSDG